MDIKLQVCTKLVTRIKELHNDRVCFKVEKNPFLMKLLLEEKYAPSGEYIISFKDIYYCPIEIIKGLTDKGQFQYLTKLKGPQEGTYLYATQFLALRLRSIFYHKIPNPSMGPLYCPCKEVIITSL